MTVYPGYSHTMTSPFEPDRPYGVINLIEEDGDTVTMPKSLSELLDEYGHDPNRFFEGIDTNKVGRELEDLRNELTELMASVGLEYEPGLTLEEVERREGLNASASNTPSSDV